MGHIYYRKRKYQASLDLYQEALAIHERLGNEIEAGRTLSSSLQDLIYLGRYPEAMEHAQQARATSSSAWATACASPGSTPTWATSSTARIASRRPSNCTRAPTVPFSKSANPRMSPSRSRTPPPVRSASTISAKPWQPTSRPAPTAWSTRCRVLVVVADYNIAYLYYLRGEYTRSIELYRAAARELPTWTTPIAWLSAISISPRCIWS